MVDGHTGAVGKTHVVVGSAVTAADRREDLGASGVFLDTDAVLGTAAPFDTAEPRRAGSFRIAKPAGKPILIALALVNDVDTRGRRFAGAAVRDSVAPTHRIPLRRTREIRRLTIVQTATVPIGVRVCVHVRVHVRVPVGISSARRAPTRGRARIGGRLRRHDSVAS